MCVWNIPADRVDDAGRVIAGFDEVTHCFRRPVSDMWPYAIFCMIHGRVREESGSVAQRIAEAVKPIDYRLLYSTVELKKCSAKLSLPESSCVTTR